MRSPDLVRPARRAARAPQAVARRIIRAVRRRWKHSSLRLRWRLRGSGAALWPRRPGMAWQAWTNTALRTAGDAQRALEEVRRSGLPAHPDVPKNWDLLVALGAIIERVPKNGRILDAGSTQYSKLLPWLFLHGYRRLHGIDLTYRVPIQAGPIRYEPMDLTATRFPDASFDAITCLSVIEHGVPLEAYVREAARLLKRGGLLITSTDYWCEPVDTGGREAYGVPIRILTPGDIDELVALAARHGLRPTGPLDLRCDERVVRWERFDLDYTFVNVVLEKDAGFPTGAGAEAAARTR